jgi:hypothetical protein
VPTIHDSFARSAEEKDELRQIALDLASEARSNWNDPMWQMLMGQAITDAVTVGFEHENLLDILTTVERVGEDGRIFVKETKGLEAFWTARGGYIEISRLVSDVTELIRDTIGYHVYEFADKLRNNFGETAQTLITLGTQRLDAEVNLRVLRTFQAAIPSSGTNSQYYVSGAGLQLPALDSAINQVFDNTLQSLVTVVGRRTMTGQIVDKLTAGGYAGFLPETNEDLLRRGVLGQYKGATIVTLKNYRDDLDKSFFPANELYVVGRDASKFGFWGGMLSKEWEDHNWYWHHLARQDFGGGVFRPDRLRRIVDSSLAP